MDAKMATGADRARSLELFAAVARTGSFSAAGREMDLTPSAVSRAIDRIEARLGVRLLLRSTRALTLTAEGRVTSRPRGAFWPIWTMRNRRLPTGACRAGACGSARPCRMGGFALCPCWVSSRASIPMC
jgi:hypothetical protein